MEVFIYVAVTHPSSLATIFLSKLVEIFVTSKQRQTSTRLNLANRAGGQVLECLAASQPASHYQPTPPSQGGASQAVV